MPKPTGIDILTDKAAVVIHDRPIAAATTWLTDVIRFTNGIGRELHLIAPPGTRLTLPLRTLLDRMPGHWVVRSDSTNCRSLSSSARDRLNGGAMQGRPLTPLPRDRSQNSRPTWIVAIGAHDRPAIVTIRIAHTRAGVEEHITLAVGHPGGGRARVPSSCPGAGTGRTRRH
ncbi:DUF6177 family protein [Streptomyces sp. NBC_00212]|uniref:DUF6177 family protein n=1 Tax=Streptomyces sp. NBC_00212 TaxID=2975684 RepID=UPI003869A0AB